MLHRLKLYPNFARVLRRARFDRESGRKGEKERDRERDSIEDEVASSPIAACKRIQRRRRGEGK
jgi:hypothetical protein